jgi:hypothetical protein
MGGVPVTVRAVADCDTEHAFDVIAPIDLASIFPGYGPLPAVRGVRDQSGAWDHAGATRVVELSDGNEAPETITSFDRPGYFAYTVGPFTGPMNRVVAQADGEWWFAPATGGTEITWTYTFRPRPRMGAVTRLVVAPMWRAYARRVLALALRAAEATP